MTKPIFAVEMALLCGLVIRSVVNKFQINTNEYVMSGTVGICALYYYLLNTVQRKIMAYRKEDHVKICL